MDEQEMPKGGRRKAAMCELDKCCGGGCSSCQGCSCGCGGNNWRCYHGCFLTRWILGLIIICFVFWCGMKVGELKAELQNGYGRMGDYGRFEMMSPKMMLLRNDISEQLPPTPTPVKVDQATKKK